MDVISLQRQLPADREISRSLYVAASVCRAGVSPQILPFSFSLLLHDALPSNPTLLSDRPSVPFAIRFDCPALGQLALD